MARRTDPDAATVRLVRTRDDWRCARCAGQCGPLTTQHRRGRGMGGSTWPGINRPDNLLTLGGSGTTGCHGQVEHHPRWADAHGWAVSRWCDDPWEVPVWTWRGWVLLTPYAEVELLTNHPGVAGCDCGCNPAVTPPDLWALPTY